jgi:hypothetical protein
MQDAAGVCNGNPPFVETNLQSIFTKLSPMEWQAFLGRGSEPVAVPDDKIAVGHPRALLGTGVPACAWTGRPELLPPRGRPSTALWAGYAYRANELKRGGCRRPRPLTEGTSSASCR